MVNGWTIGGQTVAQSGQPYSVYDYSGSVGSLYFGTDVYIENPIVPLASGVTSKQAQLQGTTGVNAGQAGGGCSPIFTRSLLPRARMGFLPAMHRGAMSSSPSSRDHRPEYVPWSFSDALRCELGQGVPHYQGPIPIAL